MAKHDAVDKRTRRTEILAAYPEWTDKYIGSYRANPRDCLLGNKFLKRGNISGLTGGTSSGKSVLAQQLACCLALGKPLFGKIPVARKCRVLLIQDENDEEVIQDNRRGMIKGLGVSRFPGVHIHRVDAVNDLEFFEVLDALLWKHKPDVVIVDPYQDYIGDNDINSFEAAQLWTRRLKERIKRFHFAALILFHTGKLKEGNDGSPAYKGAYLSAGTSKISNCIRSSCELMLSGGGVNGAPKTYRLSFSKPNNCAGIVEDGKQVDSIRLVQSGDSRNPFWRESTEPVLKEEEGSMVGSILAFIHNHCPDGRTLSFSMDALMKNPEANKAFFNLGKSARNNKLLRMAKDGILGKNANRKYYIL